MSPNFTRQNQGALLWIPAQLLLAYAYGAFTLYGGPFQATSALPARRRLVLNPTSAKGFPKAFGLGSSPFGRPYSGNPGWFLFLPLLRCFTSGGSHSLPGAPPLNVTAGFPFGHPRI